MGRGLAEARYTAAGRSDSPDVGCRDLSFAPAKNPKSGRDGENSPENQCVVTAVVEKQKGHSAKEFSVAREDQDTCWIEIEVAAKGLFPNLNPRDHPGRHVGDCRNFPVVRRANLDRRLGR